MRYFVRFLSEIFSLSPPFEIVGLQEGKVVLKALFDLLVHECGTSLEKSKELEEVKHRYQEAHRELLANKWDKKGRGIVIADEISRKEREHDLTALEERFSAVNQNVDESQVQIYGQVCFDRRYAVWKCRI